MHIWFLTKVSFQISLWKAIPKSVSFNSPTEDWNQKPYLRVIFEAVYPDRYNFRSGTCRKYILTFCFLIVFIALTLQRGPEQCCKLLDCASPRNGMCCVQHWRFICSKCFNNGKWPQSPSWGCWCCQVSEVCTLHDLNLWLSSLNTIEESRIGFKGQYSLQICLYICFDVRCAWFSEEF